MKNEEFNEQKAFVEWCQWHGGVYSGLLRLAHHVPNGGLRSKATAGKMKALGVKPGIPDIMIPVPNGKFCGLAIEFKATKRSASDTQKAVHDDLRAVGWLVVVCWTADSAIAETRSYFGNRRAWLREKKSK